MGLSKILLSAQAEYYLQQSTSDGTIHEQTIIYRLLLPGHVRRWFLPIKKHRKKMHQMVMTFIGNASY